jgi:hypothetical protein
MLRMVRQKTLAHKYVTFLIFLRLGSRLNISEPNVKNG